VKKITARNGKQASDGARPKKLTRAACDEELLRKASKHLVLSHGMFYVATAIKEDFPRGNVEACIISISIRYPTGHEGYVGDWRYDGQKFEFVTDVKIMEERAAKIAEDPERNKKWDENRSSGVPARAG
jgi:hypothetical protein